MPLQLTVTALIAHDSQPFDMRIECDGDVGLSLRTFAFKGKQIRLWRMTPSIGNKESIDASMVKTLAGIGLSSVQDDIVVEPENLPPEDETSVYEDAASAFQDARDSSAGDE